MGFFVGFMFIGVSILAGSPALGPRLETVISQIGRAVFGTGRSTSCNWRRWAS